MTVYLINPRWVNIPEDPIYEQLARLGITTWGNKTLTIAGRPRHYLFGGDYAYPYSLPSEVIDRLASRLNGVVTMTWYKDYNVQAMTHFNKYGFALNQAHRYWSEVGNDELPQPLIKPVDGLNDGDEYIAIIGLFHLTGGENGNNHHLFIDLIDEQGDRIYDHTPPLWLYYGWAGMTTEQERAIAPVRIDKPGSEPGANTGLTWGQVLNGFHINNVATDRFEGVHVRYGDDETGNRRGHHSHYIVLQKRVFRSSVPPEEPEPEPPEPKPEPIPEVVGGVQVTVNVDWINTLRRDKLGNVTFFVNVNK